MKERIRNIKEKEERAKKALDDWDIDIYYHYSELTEDSFKEGYVQGATEQERIDHSAEHLAWIIKQYNNWQYEMWHCDVNEQCTFKEWIDEKMNKETYERA